MATMLADKPQSVGRTEEFKQWLSRLLTMSDLQRIFRRSELTISGWMKNGLPVIRIPGQARDTIRFDRDEVLSWAREQGKRLFLQERDDED